MDNCPLDTPVYIIDEYHNIYVGTFTKINNRVCRGDCIVGDCEMFYRMKLIAWAYFR